MQCSTCAFSPTSSTICPSLDAKSLYLGAGLRRRRLPGDAASAAGVAEKDIVHLRCSTEYITFYRDALPSARDINRDLRTSSADSDDAARVLYNNALGSRNTLCFAGKCRAVEGWPWRQYARVPALHASVAREHAKLWGGRVRPPTTSSAHSRSTGAEPTRSRQHPTTLHAPGLVTVASLHPAAETIERFEAAVRAKGWAVFAKLDHAAAAELPGSSSAPAPSSCSATQRAAPRPCEPIRPWPSISR